MLYNGLDTGEIRICQGCLSSDYFIFLESLGKIEYACDFFKYVFKFDVILYVCIASLCSAVFHLLNLMSSIVCKRNVIRDDLNCEDLILFCLYIQIDVSCQ